MDLSQILENHCFYCNGLGNLHNVRHEEMTHAELDCALLDFSLFFILFFFTLLFPLELLFLIHLLSDEIILSNEDNGLTVIQW